MRYTNRRLPLPLCGCVFPIWPDMKRNETTSVVRDQASNLTTLFVTTGAIDIVQKRNKKQTTSKIHSAIVFMNNESPALRKANVLNLSYNKLSVLCTIKCMHAHSMHLIKIHSNRHILCFYICILNKYVALLAA